MDQNSSGPSERHANSVRSPGQRHERNEALRLREALWAVSTIDRIRKCGRVPRGTVLEVRGTPQNARLTGLCRCGSIWACTCCGPEIRSARGAEITLALDLHLSAGNSATFTSSTARHGLGHSLPYTFGSVADGLKAVWKDRHVRTFRKAHDWWGLLRTVETNFGERNGWHPHAHWLDLWGPEFSDGDRDEWEYLVWFVWSNYLGRRSEALRPDREHGVQTRVVGDAEPTDFGQYMVGVSTRAAGYELTSMTTKQARGENMSPFDILRHVADQEGSPWVERWWEWERATFGRHMFAATPGLMVRLGLPLDDPVIVEDVAPVIAYVTVDEWNTIRRSGRGAGAQAAIEMAAAGGRVGVREAVRLLLGGEPLVLADSVAVEFDWKDEDF